MFALDHTHYSWWIPVHKLTFRKTLSHFSRVSILAGKFVVLKTSNKFLAMAIDQCQELNIATVKDPAFGAIDLMTNPDQEAIISGSARNYFLY